MTAPLPSLTEAQAAVVAARHALADAKARARVPPEAIEAVRRGERVAVVARRLHVDYHRLWYACRAAGASGSGTPPRTVLACTAPGCDRPQSAKGLCSRHYWAAHWRDYPSCQKRLAGVRRTPKPKESTP